MAFLTVSEVAATLRLKPDTIRKMIKNGHIDALKIKISEEGEGHTYRIHFEVLKDYVKRVGVKGKRPPGWRSKKVYCAHCAALIPPSDNTDG